MLLLYDRRINIIQINILKGSKNWMIKWTGHSEKGLFTREVAGKHKIIFKLFENYPKHQSIKVFQLYDTSGKWQNIIQYLAFSSSLSIFEDTFAVLPLAFSMLSSPV